MKRSSLRPAGVTTVAVLSAAATLLAACAASTTPPPGGGDGHRSTSTRLHDVMRGFDDEVRRNVPAEVDEHDRWEGVYARIADAALAVKDSASRLAGRPPDGLELPDRGRFQVMARTLEGAAERLQDAAARGDADTVLIARDEVAAACRDCHSRYRPAAPGTPDAFR